jgi:hypothetical protein
MMSALFYSGNDANNVCFVIINLLCGVFRPANAGPLNVDTLDIGTVPQVFGVVQVRVFLCCQC